MIGMSQKQNIIIRYFRLGQSQRKISRDLGINRKTVRRYIGEYESARKNREGDSGDLASEALLENIMEAPKYDSSKRTRRKLTKSIIEQIDSYMAQNAEKRSSGRRKQVMKKIDVWEALIGKGFDISYPSVCNYMRSKGSKKEAFIRQEYLPGSVCEFDWGEVKLQIGGVWRPYQLAVFTMAWSNYRYAYLYHRQNTQSFQQSHIRFFEHLGGTPLQLVYDNMRVAVKRFVGPNEKEATEGLLGMSMYYQFDFRFCNVRRANEKGHVERSVEYIRRKAFCIVDSFEDLKSANIHLLGTLRVLNEKVQKSKGSSATFQIGQARSSLGYLPPQAMECAELKYLRVDKYATICMAQNHYSVPDNLVGKILRVKVYPDYLVVYDDGRMVCKHQRHYTHFGWFLQLGHYLSTLGRKPGALRGASALAQADSALQHIYRTYFYDNPREFIDLLHYKRKKGLSLAQLNEVITVLLRLGCRHISLDKIKVSLENAPVADQAIKDGQIEQLAKVQLQQLAGLFHHN